MKEKVIMPINSLTLTKNYLYLYLKTIVNKLIVYSSNYSSKYLKHWFIVTIRTCTVTLHT